MNKIYSNKSPKKNHHDAIIMKHDVEMMVHLEGFVTEDFVREIGNMQKKIFNVVQPQLSTSRMREKIHYKYKEYKTPINKY